MVRIYPHTAAYATEGETPQRPFVAAWLFCRSQGKRLLTRDGRAYVYLVYEQASAGGEPGWVNHGWCDDEFREFEHWE